RTRTLPLRMLGAAVGAHIGGFCLGHDRSLVNNNGRVSPRTGRTCRAPGQSQEWFGEISAPATHLEYLGETWQPGTLRCILEYIGERGQQGAARRHVGHLWSAARTRLARCRPTSL